MDTIGMDTYPLIADGASTRPRLVVAERPEGLRMGSRIRR